jgi:hypothetical protein
MHRVGKNALTTLSALALTACHMDQRFVSPDGSSLWQLALTADTPPFYSDGDVTVFLIDSRIELPVRAPTDAELESLSQDDGTGLTPYARRPWVNRHDYELQLDYVVSNLENTRQTVTVTVNGFNEFHEYNPGVSVVGDEVVIDFAQWEKTYVLEPGQRITGQVREEELDEVAVDLATVVNGAPNSNQVVYFENQSDHDERSQMYIPSHVPALTGLRAGLRAQAEPQGPMDTPAAPRIAPETSVHARDVDDRLISSGQTAWTLPVPELFAPVVPMME